MSPTSSSACRQGSFCCSIVQRMWVGPVRPNRRHACASVLTQFALMVCHVPGRYYDRLFESRDMEEYMVGAVQAWEYSRTLLDRWSSAGLPHVRYVRVFGV